MGWVDGVGEDDDAVAVEEGECFGHDFWRHMAGVSNVIWNSDCSNLIAVGLLLTGFFGAAIHVIRMWSIERITISSERCSGLLTIFELPRTEVRSQMEC